MWKWQRLTIWHISVPWVLGTLLSYVWCWYKVFKKNDVPLYTPNRYKYIHHIIINILSSVAMLMQVSIIFYCSVIDAFHKVSVICGDQGHTIPKFPSSVLRFFLFLLTIEVLKKKVYLYRFFRYIFIHFRTIHTGINISPAIPYVFYSAADWYLTLKILSNIVSLILQSGAINQNWIE